MPKRKASDYEKKNIEVTSMWSQKMIDDYNNSKTYQKNGLRSAGKNKGTFAVEQPEYDFSNSYSAKDRKELELEFKKIAEEKELSRQIEREERARKDAAIADMVSNAVVFLIDHPELVVDAFNKVKKAGRVISKGSRKLYDKALGMISPNSKANAKSIKEEPKTSVSPMEEKPLKYKLTIEEARTILVETITSYIKAKQGMDILSHAVFTGEELSEIATNDMFGRIDTLHRMFPKLMDMETTQRINDILQFNTDDKENNRIRKTLMIAG